MTNTELQVHHLGQACTEYGWFKHVCGRTNPPITIVLQQKIRTNYTYMLKKNLTYQVDSKPQMN